MINPAFEIHEPPAGDQSPVVVEVPHAGLELDAEAMAFTRAPVYTLARDADLYVDELFGDAPALGATLVTARQSRFVIDLNRAPDDFDALAVVGGQATERPRGVVWRTSSDGSAVLTERLPVAEYERRIASIWRPYHAALAALLERTRERFGLAVLLCAHSMPTPQPRGVRAKLLQDADIVPGSRGRSSAAGRFIDVLDEEARARAWVVRHDVPYRGGYSTSQYGRPRAGWHAVQLEIARRLYMDERTLARDAEGFSQVKQFARDVVSALVAEANHVYRHAPPVHQAHTDGEPRPR